MFQPYARQDYHSLKRHAISSGKLFVDPQFPPNDVSLFFHPHSDHDLVWKRPRDICEGAQFMVDGVQGSDVVQGMLGNCWFVAACSAITRNLSLIQKIIPNAEEQEMRPSNYGGIFHFKFWRMGEWIDIVVDDLIPCKNNKLVFARSHTPNEFWIALLEKAFAKLSGCYESLVGGTLSGAFMDVSGGVPQCINIASRSQSFSGLFTEMRLAFNNDALLAAVINVGTPEECEERLECGLVKGHSYAITALKSVVRCDNVPLNIMQCDVSLMVRLQNPWGGVEWNGPWSDGSRQWEQVSKQQKEEMGLTFDEDGEFWMSWKDFCRYFTLVTVCHRLNDVKNNEHKAFHCQSFKGAWKKDTSLGHLSNRAGGCLNFKESCLENPQYLLEVEEDLSDTIISLVQEDQRKIRGETAFRLTIGFAVFKVEDNRKYRLHKFTPPLVFSEYSNACSTFLKIESLAAGRYVILPTTFAPAEEAGFLIRIYTKKPCQARELKKHCPMKNPFRPKINLITKLRVLGADNMNPELSVYCAIVCGKESVRSSTVCKSASPKWNLSAIFYRTNVKNPITVQLFAVSTGKDICLETISVETPLNNVSKQVEIPLKKGPNESKVSIEVATFDDPLFL